MSTSLVISRPHNENQWHRFVIDIEEEGMNTVCMNTVTFVHILRAKRPTNVSLLKQYWAIIV